MNQEVIQSVQSLRIQAASLLLYQDVFAKDAGSAYLELLDVMHEVAIASVPTCLEAYGQWFKAMAQTKQSWQDYLITQILTVANPFTQQAQKTASDRLSPALRNAVRHDLEVLQNIAQCGGEHLQQWLQQIATLSFPLVIWHDLGISQNHNSRNSSIVKNSFAEQLRTQFQTAIRWADLLPDLAAYYRQCGSGIFAEFAALHWQTHELVGIPYPDPIHLDELIGCDLQRSTLLENTEFFLAGYPALHVLLYGSRGSGKSSMVKALLHRYSDRGLRLIEVAKSDLKHLPAIADQLRDSSLKFIIFVYDLSFESEEEDYKALKVLLEGNLTAKPANLLVYATSNRRHLLREYFSDRPRPSTDEEVNPWDTMQEKLSLSDRFGLTLTFSSPDQDTYLKMVQHLAAQSGIKISAEDLSDRALQWATRHNGRSGRTARQFIDFLRADLATSSNLQ